MSYQDIKSFLYDLTDYEYLSSIANIDNYQKSIFMKPAFWNTFVSTFVELVTNQGPNYIKKLCYRIKECMVWRLSLVRRRAFVKFFTAQIHVPIYKFHNKLANYCVEILDVEQNYVDEFVGYEPLEEQDLSENDNQDESTPVANSSADSDDDPNYDGDEYKHYNFNEDEDTSYVNNITLTDENETFKEQPFVYGKQIDYSASTFKDLTDPEHVNRDVLATMSSDMILEHNPQWDDVSRMMNVLESSTLDLAEQREYMLKHENDF